MNAPSGTEIELPVATQPEVETRDLPTTYDHASNWLCAWCLNLVASECDRFQYEGRDEFTFSNPEGIRFEIITFSRTLGCRQTGKPTQEHTWFAGHTWSFCHCAACGQHLGWYYTGPQDFVGLIRNRIVRAFLVRN